MSTPTNAPPVNKPAEPEYFSQYDGKLDRRAEELLADQGIGIDHPNNRLIDIGAADGFTFSNSRRFIKHGWGALMVEPQPNCLQALITRYADNPEVHVIGAAIAKSPSIVCFHDDGGGMVATLDQTHHDLWAKQAKYRRSYVAPITWEELLAAFPGQYDYVTIDVEGTNFEVLSEMPARAMGPALIVVEYSTEDRQGERDRMTAWADANGYKVADDIECNLFLIPK